MAEISLRAEVSELASLADFIERFAEEESLDSKDSLQLNLVLEELVMNTISHGHRDGEPGVIQIRLERDRDVVQIDLVDEGVEFDPRSLPAPDLDAPLEERDPGGLGVHLVRQIMDEFDYRREGGKNHLRLSKRVKFRAESDEGHRRG